MTQLKNPSCEEAYEKVLLKIGTSKFLDYISEKKFFYSSEERTKKDFEITSKNI